MKNVKNMNFYKITCFDKDFSSSQEEGEISCKKNKLFYRYIMAYSLEEAKADTLYQLSYKGIKNVEIKQIDNASFSLYKWHKTNEDDYFLVLKNDKQKPIYISPYFYISNASLEDLSYIGDGISLKDLCNLTPKENNFSLFRLMMIDLTNHINGS